MGVRLRFFLVLAVTAGITCAAPVAAGAASTATASSIQDASSAPDELTASEIAQAYGHSVLIDSETTETATVAAMPDGSNQLTESTEPVRVRAGDGWVAINTNLAVASDGLVAPTATAVPVEFSNGGTGIMARMQSDSGDWLTESWAAGALPVPTLSGASATYHEVFPGVDLQLSATAAGMSEVLIVKDQVAADDPELQAVKLTIAGTSTTPIADTGAGTGASAITTSIGLSSASPSWWDSTQPGSGPQGPGGLASPRPLSDVVSSSAIVLDVTDVAKLAGVTFPMYADPDWGVLARTFVDSAYATQSYWNGAGASDAYQHVGFVDAANSDDGRNHTTRAFWRMDSHLLAGTHVLQATFNTTETYSFSCSARRVNLYSVGAISSATTWNSGPAFGTYQSYADVAWGYSTACSARAVGFDVLQAAQASADASSSSITLGMMVPDDTSAPDKYTWKKFAAAATLVASYNHAPGVPAGRSVKPCSFVCAAPVMTNTFYPTFSAISSDVDGGNQTYNFQVWAGHSATPTTLDVAGSVHNVAYGSIGYWQDTSHLPDGDYEYRVQAFDGTDVSDWSTYVTFTVDTIAPSAPALTESGSVSTDPNSVTGTVGVTPESVTMTPNSADHAWGYAYAIYPSGAQVSMPANLSCNTTVNGYTTVCPGSVNAAATVTVTMPDDHAVFAATEFDAAGNAPSSPSSVAFYALGDYTGDAPGDTYAAELGHSWPTDAGAGSCPGGTPAPVADSQFTGAADLTTLSGGACWTQDVSAPAQSGQTIDFTGNGALTYSGAAATVTTSASVIDTTKSFTVAAWLKPAQESSTIYQSAIAQDATSLSSFRLLNGGGHWQLCLTNSSATTTFAGDCASSAGTVSANAWTFVAGVYDAANHQLLLYTSTGDTPGTPVVGSHPAATLASSGPVAIGRGRSSASYDYWSGSVLDPVVMQGVADTTQLHQFADLVAPSALTAPVIGS